MPLLTAMGLSLSSSQQVTDVWFGRTIIRSSHQLAYQQAQDILDGKPAAPGDELPPGERQKVLKTVELLSSLAEKRKARQNPSEHDLTLLDCHLPGA